VLVTKVDSHMYKYKLGITKASEKLCQTLLNSKQDLLKNTIFRDDIFVDNYERVRGKNEARIFKDFILFIAPSTKAHAALNGANYDLDVAIESVNED
jgi:hypothetical protein